MKGVMNKWVTRTMILGCIAVVLTALAAGPATADTAAAKKWIDTEFQPSTLTKDQQLKEMEWFIQAAKPFRGMNIKVVSLTARMALFLQRAVRVRKNILVSGGTGSGKTTLLNVLSAAIPAHEIITIEDSAELQLVQPHVVSLESRPPNMEGRGEVTIRDLVRNAMRMRPDRIIIGEVRGAEALDMLQAMNTGYEGSLSTVHANSPRDALHRIETMVVMAGLDLPVRSIRQQVSSALDLVVHLDRLEDGSRHVAQITEVQRMESDVITLQDLFTLGALRALGADVAEIGVITRDAGVVLSREGRPLRSSRAGFRHFS